MDSQLNFLIRPTLAEDTEAISQLIIKSVVHFHSAAYTAEEIAIWKRGYTPELVKQQILSRESYVLVVDGETAGTIQFDPPEIKGLYLDPAFSGQGHGQQLLQHMLASLKTKGLQQVELTSNHLTVKFYEKAGFELLGKEIVYWESHPFTEYRMVMQL